MSARYGEPCDSPRDVEEYARDWVRAWRAEHTGMTHSPCCYRWHMGCMLARLLDQIDVLKGSDKDVGTDAEDS